MSRRVLWRVVAIVVASAVGAGAYVANRWGIGMPATDASAFQHLLAARLVDHVGTPQPLDQWRGKILVVNFWATWCQPCREEMPILSRLQTKYADKGVQIVGIALDTAANVTRYATARPTGYPLLTGDSTSTELSRALGNSQLAVPFTVVFDTDGAPKLKRLGRFSEAELDSTLARLAGR